MGLLIPISKAFNLSSTQMADDVAGIEWPPRDHKNRLNNYDLYRGIWSGAHEDWLDSRNLIENHDLFIAVNLPKLITTIPADLMLGEPVTIEGDDTEQIHEIWDRNRFQTLMYEQALDAGHQGDGVFVVSRGEDGKARIGTVQARHWFPDTNPDDVRDIRFHRVVWERTIEDGRKEKKLLRVVEYHRGAVLNKLWVLKDGEVKGDASDADWRALYGDAVPEQEIKTGIDDFLLVAFPNFRTASGLFGQSDYRGMESLFSALDARLTQIDVVLGKHSDPMLSVPGDMFNWLETKHKGASWRDKLEELRLMRQGENGEKSEYVTWDGQLSANFEAVRTLTEEILMVGEIDRQLVGSGDFGNISGRALRVLLMRTLAKVNRKWGYMKPACELVLRLAQQVEGKDAAEFELLKSDGLPADRIEDIQASNELVMGRLSSRLREMMKLHDIDEDAARELMAEIDDEDDAPRNSEPLQNRFGRSFKLGLDEIAPGEETEE